MCWLMNSNPVPIVCVKRPPLGLSGSLSALTVVPMSGAEDSVSFSLCAVATFDAPTNRRLLNHSAFATATAKSFLHGITTLRQRQSSPQFATPKTPASGSLLLMRWGPVPYFAKSLADFKGFSTINARAENILKTAMSSPVSSTRLIPVT